MNFGKTAITCPANTLPFERYSQGKGSNPHLQRVAAPAPFATLTNGRTRTTINLVMRQPS
jgi:hypothetical protein